MSYILLLITALMWSFVGVMVKAASGMVDSSVITLCRFLFGVIFLGAFILIKDKKVALQWKYKWIWFGVLGKCCNYIFENIAISMGFAYGNIIVGPIQAIFLTFISIMFLKEVISSRKIIAAFLCIIGVVLITWKGANLSEFFKFGTLPTFLFILSAIGAGIHLMSQKKLIENMDSGNMNLSVFLICSFVTAVPVPFTFHFTGNVNILAICSLIGLGFITGVSFYIYAVALKKVSFLAAVFITNTSVLFTLLWAWLFFNENINSYIIFGAIILISGLILINIPGRSSSDIKE